MINLLSLYKKALLGRVALAALLCFSAITSTAHAKVCFLPAGNCDVIPDSTSISSACPIGTSTSCGIGYDAQTTSTNGCYKCVKVCPSGQTSTPCEEGFTAEGTTTAGCHKCVKNNCDGFNLTKLPDSNSGWKNCKSCKTGTTTKYKCEAAACPSGSAVNKTCGSGWTVNNVMIEGTSTFAKSGDGICQKCVAKTCEVGGTDVSCNSTCQEKVSTNYKSGDSTCYECKTKTGYTYANGKCEPSETCDIGYANIGTGNEPACTTNFQGYSYVMLHKEKCFQCYCFNDIYKDGENLTYLEFGGLTYDTKSWNSSTGGTGNADRHQDYYYLYFSGYDQGLQNPLRVSADIDYIFYATTDFAGNISAENRRASFNKQTFSEGYELYLGQTGELCNSCHGDSPKITGAVFTIEPTADSRHAVNNLDLDWKMVLKYNNITGSSSEGEWRAEIYYHNQFLGEDVLKWGPPENSDYPYQMTSYLGSYTDEGKLMTLLGDKDGIPYVSEYGVDFPYMSSDFTNKTRQNNSNVSYYINYHIGICGGETARIKVNGIAFPLNNNIWASK